MGPERALSGLLFFCPPSLRQAARFAIDVVMPTCIQCRRDYVLQRNGCGKYCSRSCYNIGRGARRKDQIGPEPSPVANARWLLCVGGYALVDSDVFESASAFSWQIKRGRYVAGQVHGRSVALHRFILDAAPGSTVDHISGDITDNRRCNLRFVSRSENLRNSRSRGGSSQFKGVAKHPNGKWLATIWYEKRQHTLGYFVDEHAAARAYDDAAREHFGKFGRFNFPRDGEQPAVMPILRPRKQRREKPVLSA